MDLDEEIREFLAIAPDSGSTQLPIGPRRTAIRAASDRLFDRFTEPGPQVARVTDHLITNSSGPVRVRIYRPDESIGLPVHLFLHGGGFWLGSVDEKVVDATCRERAIGAGCVVVSADYRLAPEHPFPIPVEDCYAALLWIAARATDFGGDADNISVGGVSAGATLAAAVAIAARDRGGPVISHQILEVPLLDLTLDTLRASRVGDAYGLTEAELRRCAEQYLPRADQVRDRLVSPLLTDDLSRLPPATVLTAECDPLRLDGETYAERLRAEGVPVSHLRNPGAVHGSIILTRVWAPARAWREQVLAALRTQHTDRSGRTTMSHEGGY